MNKKAGEHLKEIREILGLSIDNVAVKIGYAKSHIVSIESNRAKMSPRMYLSILRAYGNRISPQRRIQFRNAMLDDAKGAWIDFNKFKNKALIFQRIAPYIR